MRRIAILGGLCLVMAGAGAQGAPLRSAFVSAPPAPVAAFTFSPTSPAVGQTVNFNGTGSSCSATPCKYLWNHGAGTTTFGTAATATYAYRHTGLKTPTLTVTDALGRTSSVEHDITVSTSTAAPFNSSSPTISGTPQQGDTLTASPGSWTNSPSSYAYQWQRCSASCSNISGATASTYTVQSADVSDTIKVVVTATNAGGSASATSAQTGVVSAPSAPVAAFTFSPTSPAVGQTVNFNGTGSSCSATPCTYLWNHGAGTTTFGTAATATYAYQYTGLKTPTLTVTDALGRTSTIEHDITVSTSTAAPSNSSSPTISGTPQQGDTLTASPGSWTNSPTSYAYQWQKCASGTCQNISGATSGSYTLQSSDVGSAIDVVVTATNAGGSGSATSTQTAVVSAPSSTAAPTISGSAPTISGSAVQGQTLTVSNGTWTNSPASYAYQWQHCPLTAPCSNISGATSSSYTPVAGDQGDNLVAVVTATNASGSNSAYSDFSLPIEPSGNISRTFYIDYSSGSDSNSGTSTSSPWKDVPGSAAFTGTYTHQNGDRFIFKGGVTWPSSEFPIRDAKGGASGNPDYYGVDPTWYSGSSWTRPIWDAGGSAAVGTSGCSPSFMQMDASYEILDGVEMKNVYLGCSSGTDYKWIETSGANQVVDDIYAHDWVHTSPWSAGFWVVQGGQNNEALNSECSGLDATNSGDTGECSLADINRGDTAISMPNMFLPYCGSQTSYDEVSHSVLHTLTADAFGVHENMIESNSSSCKTDYVYNNVFTDELTGVETFLGNPPGFSGASTTVWYYDNVSYWTAGQNNIPVYMDCRNGDAVNLTAFNNTIYSQGGAAIGQITNGTSCGNATIENNQLINTSATGYSWSTGTVTASHNCVQSTSTANGQGYVNAHRYAPTSGSGCTVATGADLTTTIPPLDINGSSRPGGTWDEGAYQYHTGSPAW